MDELMSDPAQPFAASQDSENNSSQKAGAWNTKKFREEYELAKSRLTDQKFDITQYSDPLLPRGPEAMHSFQASQGFSVEAEQRLHDLIAQIRSSSGATS